MLKADFHLHAGEDVFHKLGYTSKELIDHAAAKGFEVLALTFHRDVFFHKELEDYARSKGVLLIPGVEREIEGKEFLLYNVTEEDVEKLKAFKDLTELKKKKNILSIAPHPYFGRANCLGKRLEENIELFDGIEYSHFYLPFFNLNKKARKVAKNKGLALIGNSDAHELKQIGWTYTLIDAKKNLESVFESIRNNKVELRTQPVTIKYFVERILKIILKNQ